MYPVGAVKADHWCAKSMGKVGDHLLGEIKKIIAVPSLFLSEHFSPFMTELPPFKEYATTLFDKQILVVDKKTGLRVNHMKTAKDELFKPQRVTNIQCTPRMLSIVKKGMSRWRDELLNEKKGTFHCLSVSKKTGSWKYCSIKDKIGSRGCMPTNDLAESALGATSRNLEIGSKLSTHRAAAVSDLDRHGFIARDKRQQRNRKGKLLVTYNQIAKRISFSLLK